MLRHCGAARWAYNWGLDQIKQALTAGEKIPSAFVLGKRLNVLKNTPVLPWGYTVSKCVFEGALRNLDVAVKNWQSSKYGKRKGKKVNFPHFKSKKNGIGTFRLAGQIHVFSDSIQLPRIGRIRLKEHDYLPVGAQVKRATISEQAGHWFVSVLIDTPKPASVVTTGEVIGIDVGIKTLATCSNGMTFANPKALAARTKQLSRWQRRMSRRVKGSKNRAKAKIQVAKCHKRIADTRLDAHNKAARTIVNLRPSVIVLEDLNIAGMVKNRHVAKAMSDAAVGQFSRIVTYMAEDVGIQVVKANRFFASSKTCSCCGWKKDDLTLADRTFVCEQCGNVLDRDLNAALNLKNTVKYTEIYACGDYVSPGIIQAVIAETGTNLQVKYALV
jgi:putative transposase